MWDRFTSNIGIGKLVKKVVEKVIKDKHEHQVKLYKPQSLKQQMKKIQLKKQERLQDLKIEVANDEYFVTDSMVMEIKANNNWEETSMHNQKSKSQSCEYINMGLYHNQSTNHKNQKQERDESLNLSMT